VLGLFLFQRVFVSGLEPARKLALAAQFGFPAPVRVGKVFKKVGIPTAELPHNRSLLYA
jgi:hypothetical protein